MAKALDPRRQAIAYMAGRRKTGMGREKEVKSENRTLHRRAWSGRALPTK